MYMSNLEKKIRQVFKINLNSKRNNYEKEIIIL